MYREIKNKIIEESEKIVPDILEELNTAKVQKIDSEQDLFSCLPQTKHSDKFIHASFLKLFAPAIAMATLFFVILLGLGGKNNAHNVSVLMIDVNPSIRIELKNGTDISKVKAQNEDGSNMLSLLQKDKYEEVNELLDDYFALLKEQKYIDSDNNNILVSFCGESKYEKKINKLLENSVDKFKVTVIYQNMSKKELKECEKNKMNVSAGKYYYVKKICKDNQVDVEELCSANINDISKIVDDGKETFSEENPINKIKDITKTNKIEEQTGTTEDTTVKTTTQITTRITDKNTTQDTTQNTVENNTEDETVTTTEAISKKTETVTTNKEKNTTTKKKQDMTTEAKKHNKALVPKDVLCKKDKTVNIKFDDKIEYSEDFTVQVIDENGNLCDVVIQNKNKTIKIELPDMKNGMVYKGKIIGIKRSDDIEYTDVEFGFYGECNDKEKDREKDKGKTGKAGKGRTS